MEASLVVREAAKAAGVPLTHIGDTMGKRPNYASVTLGRGSRPRVDTYAAMLSACGYILAAVPAEDVPASALVVDPAAKKDQA